MLYNNGDEITPWETPAKIGDKWENSEPTLVTKWRFSKYDLKNKK
jgi:hypothetical protein